MKKTDKTIIENQFKAFDNMLEGVSVYKLIFNDEGEAIDAELEYMNPNTVEAMDLNPEDAIGKNATELFSPDYLNPVFQSINEFLTTGKFKRLEIYYPPTDKYFIFSGFDIPDNYFAVIRVDITEQKKADEKLIAAEKNYHLVADFTYDWEEWRDNEGKLKYVSPSCKRITGYSKKEFMENSNLIFNIIYPDDLESYKKHINVHFSNSNAESIQFRIISRDKNIHWIEHICQPVYDDDGRFMGRRASNRDITERKKTEDALKSSQQMLENVLENFPGVVFWKDRNSVYLGCNKNFSRGAGLAEPSEIIGKSDFDQELPWKNEAELYRADDLQVIESGIPQLNIIETLRQVDGHVAWFDTNKVPLRDPDGNVIGVLGTSNDITERKKAEEELKESEERYRRIVETTTEGIWEMDDQYVTMNVNPAMAAMLGYTVEEMIGRYIPDFLFEEDIKEHAERMSNREKGTFGKYETRLKHKDGSERWALVSATPKKDSNGNFSGSFAMFVDITDRKKAEEALKGSEERYKSLAENIDSVLMRYDKDLRVVYLSPKAEEITGISTEEFIGRTNREVGMPEDLCDLWENAIYKVFQTVEMKAIEFDIPTDEGNKTFYLKLSPEFNPDGSVGHVLGISTDITEHKKLEQKLRKSRNDLELKVQERTVELEVLIDELKRSNQELQSFAYITSHDLQEPLRTIGNYAGLLKMRYKGQLDADADDFLDFMASGAARMKDMVQGLLDYSRVGKQGGEFREFNTEKALNAALTNLKSPIEECHAEVTHDTLPDIVANESQITRVFQNLIGNALKFRRERVPPKIHISAQKTDDKCVFSVSDNGIGIEEQYSDRIFEVFKRLHTIGEYQGVGIGLAIVKRIIDTHGGRIWVESEFGVGSTFYFTIPIKHM